MPSQSNYGGPLQSPNRGPVSPTVSSHGSPVRQETPTIRRGSQGLYVAYCQNLLNARLPHSPLWVDGIFGMDTDQRVRQFQAARGLQIDGIVGPMTWQALEAGPPAIKRRPAIAPPVEFVSGGF